MKEILKNWNLAQEIFFLKLKLVKIEYFLLIENLYNFES